jgi:DNA-binding CsgD family transcriptional regulator
VDPGSLPALLSQVERLLASAPRRRVELATPLTERELVILRLLPTRLSSREIGRELYVSVTTVRSHVQAIYRKLGVASRAEAVAHARQLGLLLGTPPTRSHLTSDEPDEYLTSRPRAAGGGTNRRRIVLGRREGRPMPGPGANGCGEAVNGSDDWRPGE